MSDRQADSATWEIGLIGGAEKRDIRIVEHNPAWGQIFWRHVDRIDAALFGLAHQVEHIGSTAVSGLPAKPIIDILLVSCPTQPKRQRTCLNCSMSAISCGQGNQTSTNTGWSERRSAMCMCTYSRKATSKLNATDSSETTCARIPNAVTNTHGLSVI